MTQINVRKKAVKSMLKRINGNNKGLCPLGTPIVIRGDEIRNTNCNKGLCPLGTPYDRRYAPYDRRYAPYNRRYAPYKSIK